MFDFEKLTVYQKSKLLNKEVLILLEQNDIHRVTSDQFRRAAFSITLNIAEGSGRYTSADKRNFYVIARGSVFECVAIIDYLKDTSVLNAEDFQKLYFDLEELSKMLYSLIKTLSKQ